MYQITTLSIHLTLPELETVLAYIPELENVLVDLLHGASVLAFLREMGNVLVDLLIFVLIFPGRQEPWHLLRVLLNPGARPQEE